MNSESAESARASAAHLPAPAQDEGDSWSTSAWAEGVEPGPRLPMHYVRETVTVRGLAIAALMLAIIAVALAVIGLSGGFEVVGDARLQ